MTICDDGHGEVVYDEGSRMGGRHRCPACTLVSERDAALGEVDGLRDQLSDAKGDIADRDSKISELTATLRPPI